MFDLQAVSSVDGVPIRYREIAVSMAMVSEIVQARAIDARNRKRRELEEGHLTLKEAALLRAHLTAAGDTEHANLSDPELSAWGREARRIKREHPWEEMGR